MPGKKQGGGNSRRVQLVYLAPGIKMAKGNLSHKTATPPKKIEQKWRNLGVRNLSSTLTPMAIFRVGEIGFLCHHTPDSGHVTVNNSALIPPAVNSPAYLFRRI